jgi:hypothetical protein
LLWIIQIDGKPAGTLAANTYLMHESGPGAHRITVVTAESQHSVELSADHGDNIFLEAVPTLGWAQSRAELRALQTEQGKKLVLDARRAALPPETRTANPASGG